MSYAALNAYENNGLDHLAMQQEVKIIVNMRGDICITHDAPFENTPLWVKYRQAAREVDILFDNGTSETIGFNIPDQINSYLVKANRVTLVRIAEQQPVEGWKTILLNELN